MAMSLVPGSSELYPFSPPLDIPRWKIQVPQQPEYCNCGPYCLYFVQQFLINRDEIVTRCLQRSTEGLEDIFDGTKARAMRGTIRTALRTLRDKQPSGDCVHDDVDRGVLNDIIRPKVDSDSP